MRWVQKCTHRTLIKIISCNIYIKVNKMEYIKTFFKWLVLTNLGRFALGFTGAIGFSMLGASIDSDTCKGISAIFFLGILVQILIGIGFAIRNIINDFRK